MTIRKSRTAMLLSVGFTLAAGSAVAQTLDPGVRPGAQRPEIPKAPPTSEPGSYLSIPPKVDRPLDKDEGEQTTVTRFELSGVEDMPQFGIARADVERIAADAISQQGGKFTIGRLEDVAEAISSYYRARGLLFATCTVPVQEVQGGVVKLDLLIGRLGKVEVEGNKRYKADLLTKNFDKLIDAPLEQGGLESALLRLNQYPGLSVTGVVKPGDEPGKGTLVAKVQQEKPFGLTIGADTFGRPETGRSRFFLAGDVNNPLGFGDKFSVFAQPSVDPQHADVLGQRYISGAYDVPTYWPGTFLQVFYRYNDYDVDNQTTEDTGLSIEGRVTEGGAEARQHWLVGRVYNLTTYEGITRKEANTFQDEVENFRDTLAVAHARVEFDMVDRRFGGLNGARLEYRRGIPDILGAMGDNPAVAVTPPTSRQGGSGARASGRFDSVLGSVYRLQSLPALFDDKRFPRLNQLLTGHKLLFQFDAQWSDDLLAPIEQFAIGGISTVRGYLSSELLFDSGLVARLEYSMPPPWLREKPAFFGKTWGELLELGAFYDYGWGKTNDPNPFDPSQPDSAPLHSTGFWIQGQLDNRFRTRLTVAAPLHDRIDNGTDLRGWFEVSYSFW